ncbi:MAG: hypothetical protein JWM59_2051 [Verrucomicrobiales bacterium]|nr:hypothetical protein [Verrucomicrobiales bacterium]
MSESSEKPSEGQPRDNASKGMRHSQGVIHTHAGLFTALEVPVLPAESVRPLYADYVIPFYMNRLCQFGPEEEGAFKCIRPSITDQLITTLLSDFNWRSRTAAAYFALILDRPGHTEHIGRLLLRSDVCFAGRAYCLYLAHIRTPEAIGFLNRYLDYYLNRPHLYYDQAEALAALRFIDSRSGSRHEKSHAAALTVMMAARPDFLKQVAVKRFSADIQAADCLRGFSVLGRAAEEPALPHGQAPAWPMNSDSLS